MKRTLEQQIRQVMAGEALEYGTDKARDTYAKDTPGQTPGLQHDPVQHQHKSSLALDGVPKEGGELTKPNFEKDAGLGKVAEAKEMKVKNCGCGQDPCETYGSKEEQMKKEEAELDEAGRWENTSQGRAYRKLSPEEKARKAKANMLNKKSGAPKSRAKAAKVGIGRLKTVYKGTTRREQVESILDDLSMAYTGTLVSLDEAMSDSERKQAAAKIFRMHQAKQAAKQASTALGKKSDPAAKAARRDSAGYKTSDDSHLDSKPKAPEKKRGRGERDLPHIVSQLRGVVDTKDGKPSSVKFKDGTSKNVSPDHAKKWLKKHDSAKPGEKLSMYKSHDSHKSFQSHVGEDVETVNELSGKTLSNYIQKSANPVKKNSAVNLASRGGYKLGSSAPDDLDAGEKEDMKAYNRGQGMQRAAIKLQKKMYGKKTNEAVNSKDAEGLKKLSKGLKGSMKAHGKQKKELDKLIQDESYDPVMEAIKNVYGEATAAQVTQARYRDKSDNPHTSAYLGRQKQGPGLKTYKSIPGKDIESDKGKMAVIKKQIARRPAQYGVDGKHDPIYPANKAEVQKQGKRQKSKATAGQYKD